MAASLSSAVPALNTGRKRRPQRTDEQRRAELGLPTYRSSATPTSSSASNWSKGHSSRAESLYGSEITAVEFVERDMGPGGKLLPLSDRCARGVGHSNHGAESAKFTVVVSAGWDRKIKGTRLLACTGRPELMTGHCDCVQCGLLRRTSALCVPATLYRSQTMQGMLACAYDLSGRLLNQHVLFDHSHESDITSLAVCDHIIASAGTFCDLLYYIVTA